MPPVLPDAVTLKDAPTHTDEEAAGVAEFVGAVGSATTVHDVVVSADSHPLTDVTARDLIL